jgi:carotenoid cleavage dioxygenase
MNIPDRIPHVRQEPADSTLNEWFVNSWKPSEAEGAYEITEIEGELPAEINGTLFRNGPSQRQLPPQGYEALHLFDGDALVHAFRFDDGRAFYTGRFVESESYLVEQNEGRWCMGSATLQCENPTDKVFMRQQHNTNIVRHGGKLMALVENAWPFRIDERTLAPIGETDYGCERLGMSVAAHPKIDGKTGQMISHGYQPFEPYVQLYTVEPDGKASSAENLDIPYSTMMHDIAITENYVIVLLCPVLIDGEPLIAGTKAFMDCTSYEPERGLKFGLKKRVPGAPIQWFEAPTPGYIFHPGNAYEENGKIMMDTCTYLKPQALLDSLRTWRSGHMADGWYANPYLYELDPATGKCSETRLDDRAAEFPRLDDRLVGQKNRYGYALLGRSVAGPESGWLDVVRYDRQGGANQRHNYGVGQFASEPVFVPRSPDSAEDDGFVHTVVYDAPNDSSYLAVLDASSLDSEPLAKAHLKHRIPQGFHGNFAAGVV